MFSFRHVLRFGVRLATRESVNFHHSPLITNNVPRINCKQKIFARSQTTLCNPSGENDNDGSTKQTPNNLEGKMKLMFTCKKCNYRNSRIISKVAYNKGVVIVRCDGCKNNHLIADNLGWFAEMRKHKNIERFLAAKGEQIKKFRNDAEGYIEVVAKAEFDLMEHNRKREEQMKEKGNETGEKMKPGSSED